MKDQISCFLNQHYNALKIEDLTALKGGGSDRKYFRFLYENEPQILTYSANVKENESFLYFTEKFNQLSINVPQIGKISENHKIYTQSDLGNVSLLDFLKSNPNHSLEFYKKTIQQLVHIQVSPDSILDYNQCYDFKEFNKMLVLRDLFYFKDFFLDLLPIEYSGSKLLKDFESLAKDIQNIDLKYFMYRDFQGRNVMVHNNEVHFIDYQGGMKGPIQYDLASILWQAKADLSNEWKDELYSLYLSELKRFLPRKNLDNFKKEYELCVIERLLQVLGAYGFRGLYEKKPHFIESIEFGIKNLEKIFNFDSLNRFLELKKIIHQMIQPETQNYIKNRINK